MSLHSRAPLRALSENAEIYENKVSPKFSDLSCNEQLVEPESDDNNVDIIQQNFQKELRHWRGADPRFFRDTLEIFRETSILQHHLCNLSLYLTSNSAINSQMRGVLVEWMVDVSHSCEQLPDTVFMAVNYLDRFLSLKNVDPTHLQLIGVSCLFVSSYNLYNIRKLNDIKIPQLDEYSYVTAGVCSCDDITIAESEILTTLEFSLVVPTSLFFSELFFNHFYAYFIEKPNFLNLIQSLCEYILTSYEICNSYYPSIVAAAVILLTAKYNDIFFDIHNFSCFELDMLAIFSCHQSLSEYLDSVLLSTYRNSSSRLLPFWFSLIINPPNDITKASPYF